MNIRKYPKNVRNLMYTTMILREFFDDSLVSERILISGSNYQSADYNEEEEIVFFKKKKLINRSILKFRDSCSCSICCIDRCF